MITGTSAWLGNKLGIEDKWVRIGFVASVLLFGVGIGIYLICWLVKVISGE